MYFPLQEWSDSNDLPLNELSYIAKPINPEQETDDLLIQFRIRFGFNLQKQSLDYSKYLEILNHMIKIPA